MGSASRRAGQAPAWRSSCLALCLLPVAVPLLLLCFPLLCVAVAVVRFRRRRRRLMAKSSRSCPSEKEDLHGDALLHKYLEDQMELVGADAGAARPAPAPAPAAVAMNLTPSSERSDGVQEQSVESKTELLC